MSQHLQARDLDDDQLRAFTVTQVAERTSLSEIQIRRMIEAGRIRHLREGRRVLIPAAALREFLEAAL